ncbi:hypothetical protein JNUCC42_00215 [Brevibacterium sp. JNUCC-42]|nr:hypothetical protein JNUCC42_00215 [Brevibacterium sp. JNUCC-42]
MNNKVLKWIIGSLVVAVIVPTVAFMLIQPDGKNVSEQTNDLVGGDGGCVGMNANGEMVKCEPNPEIDELAEQMKNGILTEEQFMERMKEKGYSGATRMGD